MPALLRPRIACFYCGTRSSYAKDGKTRQFTCHKCDATNHLDHNGDITDPPTTPIRTQTQSFAHQRPTSVSPTSSFTRDNNPFCQTCLKNQHTLTACLAEYLPSEDDPEYEKYERQYPKFRQDLERRYPPVCLRCAPRIQEHIRNTGYAAKVDFLTRSLERSKSRPAAAPTARTSAALLLLRLAGLAWWASMLLQALWHAFGLLAIPADPEQLAGMKPSMIVGCTLHAVRSAYLPPGCSHLFVDVVAKSLRLSALLAWWNPALKTWLRSASYNHQWSGRADFYRFQLLILTIRFLAWWKLSQGLALAGTNDQITRAIHGCALLFLVIGALSSQRMVTYSSAPKVIFKDTSGPLVDPESFQYPADTSSSLPSALPLNSPLRMSSPKPFDIATFGPKRDLQASAQQARPRPTFAVPHAPTPEPDMPLEEDSMDWEPLPRHTSPVFRRTHNPIVQAPSFAQPLSSAPAIPAFLRPPATASAGEKSPFTGRLPPAPISPAHRLRNPPPRPQFKPTPLSKQQDFFKQMGLASGTLPSTSPNSSAKRAKVRGGLLSQNDDDHEDDDDVQDQGQRFVRRDSSKDYFRPAQWTLKSDLDAAAQGTGLEDIFSTSFKLGDDTLTQSPRRQAKRERGGDGREIFERAPAPTSEAAKILGNNVGALIWPAVLAVLAVMVAVMRDAEGRRWAGEVVAQGMRHLESMFGIQGMQNPWNRQEVVGLEQQEGEL